MHTFKSRNIHRLNRYDYSKKGWYFITICTQNRKEFFGSIENGVMRLTNFGCMVDIWWRKLPKKYSMVEIDEYKIMPNHFHGIIMIIKNNENDDVGAGFPRPDNGKGRGDRAPTLGQIIAYFKYGSTKQINAIRNTPGAHLWQRNYYDHIIRNKKSLYKIRNYILNNPQTWLMDEYNIKQL